MSETIAVHKNAGDVFTCVTAASRPDPSHCWLRAASHIMKMDDLNFLLRLKAITTCREVARATSRPWKSPVRWGFGRGWPGQ